MKPFDLEAAKRGEPIQTRNETPVKFVAHVPEAPPSSRVVFLCQNGIYTACENGDFFLSESEKSSYDLFMAPTKRRVDVYLNLYPGGIHTGYESRHTADERASSLRLGGKAHHVIVEWED